MVVVVVPTGMVTGACVSRPAAITSRARLDRGQPRTRLLTSPVTGMGSGLARGTLNGRVCARVVLVPGSSCYYVGSALGARASIVKAGCLFPLRARDGSGCGRVLVGDHLRIHVTSTGGFKAKSGYGGALASWHRVGGSMAATAYDCVDVYHLAREGRWSYKDVRGWQE